MSEVWRPVPGFGGHYSASSKGRVRSEDRVTVTRSGPRNYGGRILRQHKDRNGYFQVTLCVDGAKAVKYVSVLVLLAFAGPAPEGFECCHNNGIKTDNRPGNLRWDTRSGNFADKVKHGTDNRGAKSPTAKLTEAQVLAIFKDNRKHRVVANEFGVSQALIVQVTGKPPRGAAEAR